MRNIYISLKAKTHEHHSMRFVLSVLMILLTTAVFGQNHLEIRINSSVDDGEEIGKSLPNAGQLYSTSSDLELVYDTTSSVKRGKQTVGLRFNNITVPQGSTITGIFIQFMSDVPTSGETNLVIYGENSVNPGVFQATPFYLSTRPKTQDSVKWSNVPAWTLLGEAGPNQRTPDLTTIVQPVVNNGLWQSGNSLVFIIQGTGNRRAYAYDDGANKAPLLVIDYNSVPTGIEDFLENKDNILSFYPNPGHGNIHLDLKDNYKVIRLKLFSNTGRLMNEEVFSNTKSIDFNFEGSSGIYFLRVECDDLKLVTLKVIRE